MAAADNYAGQLTPHDGDLYRSLFENSPLPMWIYDLDSLRFMEVNDAAVHRYGYSRAEFLEMTTSDLRPYDENDGTPKQADESPVIREWRGWRHRLKTGEVIEVEITTQGLRYNGRRAAFVIINNVKEHTPPVRVQEADDRFRQIFELSAAAMILCESEGGEITEANRASVSLLGYDQEKLCGLNISDIVQTQDEAGSLSFAAEAFNNAGRKFNASCRTADGGNIPAEITSMEIVSGGKKFLHIIFSDKTSEPVANKPDLGSDANFRELIERSPHGYYRINGNGNFVDVNRAFARMLGYTKEELLSGDAAGSVHMNASAPGQSGDSAGSTDEPELYTVRKKDGSEIRIEDYPSFSFDGDGTISYREGFCREIVSLKNESEENGSYRELFSELAEPVLVARRSDGKIIDANKAAETAHGFSRAELLERHMRDLSAAGMPESVKRKLGSAGDAHVVFEAMHRRKDGSVFPVETVLQLLTVGGEAVMVNISRDNTERKKAEAALKKNEQKYRAIFEKSPMGVLYFDAEGVITDCNESLASIMGSTRKAVTGLKLLDLPSKELVTAVKRVLDGKIGVYEGKYRSITATKSIHVRTTFAPVSLAGGRPVGGIGIFEDISEREKAEAALRESEMRYRLLYENSPVPYHLADSGGKISDVNSSWVDLLGYSKSEAVGKDFSGFVAPEHAGLLKERLEAFRSSGTLGNLELDIICKSGRRITAAIEGKSVSDAETGIQQLQFMLYDITERKMAESALKESEQKFKSLAEYASSAIFMYQADKICYVNAACTALTGFNADELIGKDFWEVVHPDFKELVKELGVARQKGESVPNHFELRIRTKSGESRWVDFTAATAQYKGSLAVLGTAYDVTERKAARKKLEESEEQHRLLVDESPDAIMVFSEGRLLYANPATLRLLGSDSVDTLAGRTIAEMFNPDTRAAVADGLHKIHKTSKSVEMKGGKILCADGSTVDVDMVGSPIRYQDKPAIQIVAKILDHHVNDVRQSRLQDIALDFADNAILITNDGFEIIWVNQAFEMLSGYSSQEAVGRDVFDFLGSGEGDGESLERIRGTIPQGKEWREEIVSRRKDGTTYTEDVTVTPVRGEGDSITHYVWTKRDCTMRKSFEDQLLKSKKLEGVGQLVGNVVHDYNNILAVILGYGEALKRNISDQDAAQMAAEAILSATRRGADLTTQLLDFEHEGVVTPRAVDVNKAIETMEGMFRKTIGEDLKLEVLPLRGLWHARVDPIHLYEILLNLATNARDAVADGSGKLEIKTSNVQVDEIFARKHADLHPGEYVMISFSDTGSGMDDKIQERIFEPFFTTKQEQHAPGLGLAAVHGMVKRNGGGITVRSAQGEGTTFCVYLPRYDGDVTGSPDEIAIPAEPDSSNGETVLLVEDDPDLIGLMKQNLEEYGYKVMAALGPEEALDICEGYPADIQILVADVMLPGINGKELSDRIAAIRPGIKTLFMSGHSPAALEPEGIVAGEVDFLQKPFTADELVGMMQKVLR